MKPLKSMLFAFALMMCTATTFADDQFTGSGTVAETIVTGGYVYVRLAENDSWLAAPNVELEVGEKVEYSKGMLMQNFTSPSLNRTFDSILFVGTLKGSASEVAGNHGPSTSGETAKPAEDSVAKVPGPGDIKPLDNGITIAVIFADREALSNQNVEFRARVMKVSKNIMGKHWITLRDGTGKAPNDRLIATTQQQDINVGDLVVARGVIQTDVDLGFGYLYEVLLEEATFSQ